MNQPIIKSIGIKNVIFGKDVTVVEPTNLYGCTIETNCFIGPFVEIQQDVFIGKNTKIQSHAFICELVEIGQDCFISHGVIFINDLFQNCQRALGNKAKWKKTKIGNNVLIGSNATILPVNICDNVVIGAGSVVTKNISSTGIYCGNPAKKVKEIQ